MSTDDALDPADFDLDASPPEGEAAPAPPPAAEPEAPPPPTPAEILDQDDIAAHLAALDRTALTELATGAVRAARADPSPAWLVRLQTLRSGLLLRNERSLLALCLTALVEVAMAQAQPARAADAAETLWGVREMLGEPYKAHAAALQLALAQEAMGQPESAEVTLHKALALAQKQAPGGNLVPASAAASRTLTQLGQLLVRQGRVDEGREWLEGAVEIAEDDESRAVARAALGQ